MQEVQPQSQSSWPRRYRKRVFRKAQATLIFALCYGAILIAYLVHYRFRIPADLNESLDVELPLSLLIAKAAMMAIYYFGFRPLLRTHVFIEPGRILIRRPEEQNELQLNEITSITYGPAGLFGGAWFEFRMRDGRKFKFTSELERADEVLDAALRVNPSLLSESEQNNLRTKLVVFDHAEARSEGPTKTRPQLIALAAITALPLLALALLPGASFKTFRVWGAAILLSMLALEFVSFKAIRWHLNSRSRRRLTKEKIKVRDIDYETTVYHRALIALGALSIIFTVILYVTNPPNGSYMPSREPASAEPLLTR